MVRFTWPQTCNILSLCCRSQQLDSGALIRTEPFASPIRTSKNYTFQQFCFFCCFDASLLSAPARYALPNIGKSGIFFRLRSFFAARHVRGQLRRKRSNVEVLERSTLPSSCFSKYSKVKIIFFSVSGVSIFPSIVVVVRFVNVNLAHFPLFVKTNSSLEPST